MNAAKMLLLMSGRGGQQAAPVVLVEWYLNEDFTDTVAAGAINGTQTTPGPGGTRIAVDVSSIMSIGTDRLRVVGTPNSTSDVLRWTSGAIPRIQGQAIFQSIPVIIHEASANSRFGLMRTNAGGAPEIGITPNSPTGGYLWGNVDLLPNNANFPFGATPWLFANVMRNAGQIFFNYRSGNWLLEYVGITGVATNLYPVLWPTSLAQEWSVGYFKVSKTPLIAIFPTVSDSFTRADASLGLTDGLGAEEGGGSGLAWTDNAGTWGISTNKAMCSALAGAGITTIPGVTADSLVECKLTRSAGNVGIVMRYTDANNYLIAYHDGTNARLDKVVAGTTTNLQSSAKAYSAGARIIARLNGTTGYLYYNDASCGAAITLPTQTGTAYGLYTTDTGNSFTNFNVWKTGTAGEWATKFSDFVNP